METAFKLLPSASPSFPDKTVNEESSWELWSTVVILLTSPHRLGMSQERFQDTLLDNQDLRMRYRPNVMPFYTAAVLGVDTGNQWHKRQMQSKKSRVFAHASTQRFSLLSRTCVSESGASKACENDAGCHPDPLKQHLLFRLKTTRRFFLEKKKSRVATRGQTLLEKQASALQHHQLDKVVLDNKFEPCCTHCEPLGSAAFSLQCRLCCSSKTFVKGHLLESMEFPYTTRITWKLRTAKEYGVRQYHQHTLITSLPFVRLQNLCNHSLGFHKTSSLTPVPSLLTGDP